MKRILIFTAIAALLYGCYFFLSPRKITAEDISGSWYVSEKILNEQMVLPFFLDIRQDRFRLYSITAPQPSLLASGSWHLNNSSAFVKSGEYLIKLDFSLDSADKIRVIVEKQQPLNRDATFILERGLPPPQLTSTAPDNQ